MLTARLVTVTPSMKIEGAERGTMPVQLIFCLKEKNQKKSFLKDPRAPEEEIKPKDRFLQVFEREKVCKTQFLSRICVFYSNES